MVRFGHLGCQTRRLLSRYRYLKVVSEAYLLSKAFVVLYSKASVQLLLLLTSYMLVKRSLSWVQKFKGGDAGH